MKIKTGSKNYLIFSLVASYWREIHQIFFHNPTEEELNLI